eukprot:Phypoly_transcript_15329.p1 GENE.Phypoly_transcript_15329~~Phypoly_transcript_15329.p1  ORF type:complete len:248 (+),score=33.33 Phypoly_transcript_15329:62-805(+)
MGYEDVVLAPPASIVFPSLWSPACFLGVPLVYVLLVLYAKRKWMNEKPVKGLEPFLVVYNFVQVLVSAYSVYLLYPIFTAAKEPWNIFYLNMPWSNRIWIGTYVVYLAKFLDLMDTFWIILKRKNDQLSVLHVTHHATVISIWGWLLWLGVGGTTVSFAAAGNSVIHTFMYLHYLLVSFKIKNIFSKYLTSMQIIQFVLFLVHSILVRFYSNSELQRDIAWVQFAYQIYMIALFSWFYNKKYNVKKE